MADGWDGETFFFQCFTLPFYFCIPKSEMKKAKKIIKIIKIIKSWKGLAGP